MTISLEYIGAAERYFETASTGKSQSWRRGQTQDVSDTDAALLMATGLFAYGGADAQAASNLAPGKPVTATTNLTGGIEMKAGDVSLGFAKKRAMYPVNLMDPRLVGGYVTTLGTASEVAATTETGHSVVTCVATAAGSTARILKGFSALTLDTAKYYELSCTVVSANFGNRANMGQPWFGLTSAPTEGTQTLSIAASAPVAGQRYSMRFRPAVASNIIRVGIGINSPENVLVGDSLVATDFSLYEIPALASTVVDYSYNSAGFVGKAQVTPSPSPASCVWAIGDSWSNDTTDWPVLVGNSYGREMRVSAIAGDTLAQMKARVDTAAALGQNWLLNPNQNIPGVAVIVGGINDLIADASFVTLATRAQDLLDAVRAKNMIPVFVLQPYATDSNYYTAGRMTIRTQFANYIKQEGCDYFDLADEGFLTAGAANATYLLSESLNWTHPTTAGVTLLTGLIERRLRDIDRSCVVLNSPVWPQI